MNNNLENEITNLSDKIISLETSIRQLNEIISNLIVSNHTMNEKIVLLSQTIENND